MQRSMSYRKPAPEYIPSPPPSPTIFCQSPAITQSEESKFHAPIRQEDDLVEKPVPPLPDNWREILAENVADNANNVSDALKAEKSIAEEQSSNQVHGVLRSQSRSTGFIDGDQESFSTVAPSQLVYLRPQRKHVGRGFPTTYRPPTPPLRSQQRQDVTEQKLNDMQMSHIYLPNPYSSYVRLGFPSPGASSLIRPTPSFRTERTLASMNTTNMSMGWAAGYPTSSERVLNRYTTQKPNTDVLIATDARSKSSDEMGCLTCCSNVTRLKSWMKKLKLTSY